MLTFCIFLLSYSGVATGQERKIVTSAQYCNEGSRFMNDISRYKILQFHNEFRSLLAEGKSPGYKRAYLPPASSVYQMRWSCALEGRAVRATQDCSRYYDAAANLAQNIYYTTDGKHVQKEGMNRVIYDAMYQWTMPAEYYSQKIEVPKFRPFNVTKYRNTAILTFANMANENIYEIGCNYEQCFDRNGNVTEAVFFCFYNKMYETTNSSVEVSMSSLVGTSASSGLGRIVWIFRHASITGGSDIYVIGDGRGCEYDPQLCASGSCKGLLCRL